MADTFEMLKQLKEQGRKIVGAYCNFAPQELVYAAGALGFSLCATKEEPIADGEKTLPRNLCPLIKSSYGFAVTDKCPFFLHADIVIGETTCDGKKKMFELMSNFKQVYVMQLPSSYTENDSLSAWLKEVIRLKAYLEKELDVDITEDKLNKAIAIFNAERTKLKELAGLLKNDPVPISGQELLKLLWGRNFVVDRQELIEQLELIVNDLKDTVVAGRGAFPKGTKRIIVTGVPTGIGSEKVIKIIEDCGAAVVYLDNCSGMKSYEQLVATDKPALEAIAEMYLNIPCSCMSPNPTRMSRLAALIDDYSADGVVDITWTGCHTYNIESRVLKSFLQANKNVPFLQIETDYSQGDTEQIRSRVQAFLEMML
jgi:benzoyl-CoA reductase/2-hydroxyglutaryl-CoA dehydratase subunit BcrC/BadD/HgdB